MALPAPKSAASTCSRTTPRMRLVIVAAPADAADRAMVDVVGGEGGLGCAKLAADGVVDRPAVRVLAGEFRHHGLHHLAHVLGRGRAAFGNGGGHGGVYLLRRRGRRQIALENGDLAGLLVHEVGTPGLGELLNR